MLDAIRALFDKRANEEAQPAAAAKSRPHDGPEGEGGGVEAGGAADPVHLAACALLLEIAYADGEFSAPERDHLEDVLARHFGLSREDGHRLLELAEVERRRSVDHFRFTSVLQRSYDVGQKMVLAEVMWGLVLADGEIAEHEHYLTRKISNLLELEPAFLSSAKAAAAARAKGGERGR